MLFHRDIVFNSNMYMSKLYRTGLSLSALTNVFPTRRKAIAVELLQIFKKKRPHSEHYPPLTLSS